MSTFPADWLRKVQVPVTASMVVGDPTTDLSDFQIPINRADLPDEMCDPNGSNHAQGDGGDIRITLDEAGTQRLPLEIFTFQLDNTTGGKDAKIGLWTKVPTLSTTTSVWVWYKTSTGTETKAIDTDIYGRNAVWPNYIAVYHAPNVSGAGVNRTFTDSTGNGYSFVESKTYSGIAHPIYGTTSTQINFNSLGSSPTLPLDQDYTVLDVVSTPTFAASGDRTWLTLTGNGNASAAIKSIVPSAADVFYVYDSLGNSVNLGGSLNSNTNNTWHWTAISSTNGTGPQTAYLDGSPFTTQNVERLSGTGVLTPGAGGNAVQRAEIWIAKGIWSANRHLTTVNSMQSGFLTAGTPQDAVASTGISLDITTGSIAFTGQSTPVALINLPAEGFQLLGTINIPATSEDLVDFPVFMNRSCFPDSLFDPSGTRRFQADGGDLRITTDEAGTLKIPVDISNFDLDTTTGAKNASVFIRFKAPLLSSANSETYYLWGAASTTKTQPASDAQEVWSDYEFVCHLDGLSVIDSAKNSTVTKVGSPALANMGATNGYQFSNLAGGTATDYFHAPITDVGNTFTLSFVVHPGSDFNNQKIVTLTSGTTAEHFVDTDNNYFLRGVVNTNGIASTGADLAQTQNFYHLTWDGTTITLYKDGVSVASQAYSTAANAVDGIYMAASGDGSGAYNGALAEVRLRRSPVSAAWASYESTNYGSIASFVSVTESSIPSVSVDVVNGALTLTGLQASYTLGSSLGVTKGSVSLTKPTLLAKIGQNFGAFPSTISINTKAAQMTLGQDGAIQSSSIPLSPKTQTIHIGQSNSLKSGSVSISTNAYGLSLGQTNSIQSYSLTTNGKSLSVATGVVIPTGPLDIGVYSALFSPKVLNAVTGQVSLIESDSITLSDKILATTTGQNHDIGNESISLSTQSLASVMGQSSAIQSYNLSLTEQAPIVSVGVVIPAEVMTIDLGSILFSRKQLSAIAGQNNSIPAHSLTVSKKSLLMKAGLVTSMELGTVVLSERNFSPVIGQNNSFDAYNLLLKDKLLILVTGTSIPMTPAVIASHIAFSRKRLNPLAGQSNGIQVHSLSLNENSLLVRSGWNQSFQSTDILFTSHQQSVRTGTALPIQAYSIPLTGKLLDPRAGFIQGFDGVFITFDGKVITTGANPFVSVNIGQGLLTLSDSVTIPSIGYEVDIDPTFIETLSKTLTFYTDAVPINAARLVVMRKIERIILINK